MPEFAACCGSRGSGTPHLINGPFDANRSNAPIPAIASLILGSKIGTGFVWKVGCGSRWLQIV